MIIDKDYVGALVSGICLIHCLAGPVLFLLGITSIGHSFVEERAFHLAISAPILFFAAWSIPKGLKVHHHPVPAMITVIAICFLSVGLIIVEFGLILSIVASCLLIFAHLYNRKLLKTQSNENDE